MTEPKHKRLAAAVEAVRRGWMNPRQAALACGVDVSEVRIALGVDRDMRRPR